MTNDVPNREAEIRAREQAASPGPWFWMIPIDEHDSDSLHAQDGGVLDSGGGYWPVEGDPNRPFISHAREDIPYLLDALDREREANRELREAAARFEEMVERRKRPDGGGVTEFEWNTRRDAMVNLSRALLHPEDASAGGKA